MNKKTLIIVVIIIGLALLASLWQKSPSSDTQEQPAKTNDISLSDKSISDIPFYPNATTKSARETSRDAEKIHFAFTLETNDSIADINDKYRALLSTNGWTIKSDKNIAGYQIIQGVKEGFYTSMQAAKGDDGKVLITQQAYVPNK